MSNYRGPETLQKYFPGAKCIFQFFPRRKKFVKARYLNLSFYADHATDANKLQESLVIITSRKQNSLQATQKIKRR